MIKIINKIRNLFLFLCFSFFALIVYQNQPYFFEKNSLHINLYFKQIITPEYYTIVLYGIFCAIIILCFGVIYTLLTYKERQYAKVLDGMEGTIARLSKEKQEMETKIKKLETKNPVSLNDESNDKPGNQEKEVSQN